MQTIKKKSLKISKGASQNASIDSVGVIFLLNVSVVGRSEHVPASELRTQSDYRVHMEYKNRM